MDSKTIIKGIACGAIYVSSFFLTMFLMLAFIDAAVIIFILSVILTNVAVGLLLASKNHLITFYKWLILLPAGAVTYWLCSVTNIVQYCLNKLSQRYPDLGLAGWALLIYMCFYILSFVIAIIISFCITSKNKAKDT